MTASVRISALLGVLGLASCAPTPESVRPVYFSPGTYAPRSCEALDEERMLLSGQMAALSGQQRDARTGDTVGVLMFGLPVASMSGRDRREQIARVKGRQEILAATIIAKCS